MRCCVYWGSGFPSGLADEQSACHAGDGGDAGSTPRSGRSPEEKMVTHPSIFAWKVPLTEEPGGLAEDCRELDKTGWLSTQHSPDCKRQKLIPAS